jgi:hypothetical protein
MKIFANGACPMSKDLEPFNKLFNRCWRYLDDKLSGSEPRLGKNLTRFNVKKIIKRVHTRILSLAVCVERVFTWQRFRSVRVRLALER